MSSNALISTIAAATSVRMTRVGEFDPRHRSRTKLLVFTSDLAAMSRLERCLEVDDEFFTAKVALMTPGILDMNFMSGHELLATVRYIYPNLIRWRGWPSDARLVNSADLIAWLVDHGWEPPPQ